MKFFKYISALAVGAFVLTSCSSDDNDDFSFNTASGVGVSVKDAEMIVNESKGIFNVPIVVTGDANGYIQVTVKITGTDDPNQDQAIADSHFYLTSNTINIPKDSKVGNVEIRTQYLPSRDDNRYFNVVIVSAVGATVEPLNTTTICIEDRMASPIYSLSGPWTFAYTDGYGAAVTNDKATLEVVNEETGQALFKNFAPAVSKGLDLPIVIREDDATGEYNINIVLGSTIGTFNFSGIGQADVLICSQSGGTSGEIKGAWNDSHTTVSFADGIMLGVYQEGTYLGYMERMTDIKATQQPQ